jgi:hypothetical protein
MPIVWTSKARPHCKHDSLKLPNSKMIDGVVGGKMLHCLELPALLDSVLLDSVLFAKTKLEKLRNLEKLGNNEC